ncbi:MAG: gluconolaconase [Phycisphaerae bacterium]
MGLIIGHTGRLAWVGLAGLLSILGGFGSAASEGAPGPWVRPGYSLTVVVDGIKTPRFMRLGSDQTLYVSVPTDGEIKACRDADGDGHYEQITTFLKAGPSVHGLCWHDGWLWYSLSTAIGRARDTDGDGRSDEHVIVIPEGRLTKGGGHWWRSILIHKGRLYTSIGDSGNITDEADTKRQKIWSYALDGSDEKLFCTGIRNTEKLVVRPGTDEIWGMDHGSDWFGKELGEGGEAGQPITDLNPPEEMNHYREGGFYGHPFIVGMRLPRYEYMEREDIVALAAKTTVPEWCGGAHWAANAMEFYTADQFPGHRGDAFVAYHGSWNRSKPAGYCVTRVLFENGRPYGEQRYVHFLPEGAKSPLGRPVDVAVAPDGTLLISDDKGNRIYRLRYTGRGEQMRGRGSPEAKSDESARHGE